ncbi:MAG: 3,4-dihydroxy-2-butanone-4-phosphate synthase [Candidatus Omnitrophota bacterium]
MKFSSVEQAVEDVKKGRLIIIVDDAKRENEGDFVGAGAKVTPQAINFMVTEARGAFIAVFCEAGRCEALSVLPQRTSIENTEANHTQMMVSVDAAKSSSGSSAFDRALTVNILADSHAEPGDLRKPGHVIPIEAVPGGVLERPGHTESGVEIVRLAGFKPAVAVDLEIMREDGHMARPKDLFKIAKRFDMSIITIKQIRYYLRRKK